MKLRNKLLFWITLVVMLTIAWVGYVGLSYIDRIVFDQTKALMRLSSKQSATQVDKWFESRRVLLSAIANDLELERYASSNPKILDKLTALHHHFPNHFDYIFIGFADKSMHSTRSVPLSADYDPTARPWFLAAQKKQAFVITEPYPDRLTGDLVATMAMPVKTAIPGVLGIDVSLADMASLCKQAVFHSAAESLLLTQSNTILYSTNNALGKTGESLGQLDFGPLEKDTSGDTSRYHYQLERSGTKYIVFLSSIPTASWAVAVALPVSVLFAEQQSLIDRILYTAAVAFILVFGLIYWIISKVTRPLAGLAITAEKLESGDMTVQFQAGESFEATYLAASLDKMKLRLLSTIEEKEKLNADLSTANRDLGLLYTQTIYALSNAIEAKDSYTHGHSSRVLLCSELVGIALNWDAKTMEHLRYAAILHDIGKIAIPEEILNKTSSLTAEEYELIKKHPALGSKILQNIPHLAAASQAIAQHHERVDGKGYPLGISGDGISLMAKVLAISDAYDAMTSGRPYRPALSSDAAYDELQKCAGSQFDSAIAKVFCGAIPALSEVARQRGLA